ncbi:MAG: hypothetical protein E7312_01985 [Clostridiales bacterium]|nr:hypothetical protein [Clostridiales bacterium]
MDNLRKKIGALIMFDEKSDKWINGFKTYTKVLFWLFLITGIILCQLGWSGEMDMTGSSFVDGVLFLFICSLFAFLQRIVNMLIIKMFYNINTIREEAEKQTQIQNKILKQISNDEQA